MLPFYKTFPFMDYYKNEDAFAKDLGTQGDALGQELLGLQPVPEPHAELELGTNNLKSSTGC